MKTKLLFVMTAASAMMLASCTNAATSDSSAPAGESTSQATSQATSEVSVTHQHEYITHAAVEPTCTEDGNEAYYTCEGCDKIFDANKHEIAAIPVVAKLGHQMTAHAAKDATCTEAGNSAYYECGRCHKFFSDEAGEHEIQNESWVIPALEHSYETRYTVGNDGKITITDGCIRGDDVRSTETVDALAAAAGKYIQPIAQIDKTAGFSISYDFAGSAGDWSTTLFNTGSFWIAAGCIGFKDDTFDDGEWQDQLCDGADGQGQEGDFQIATGWNAVIGSGHYTISFCPDGSILWYKGDNVALYFAPNKVSQYKNPGRYYDTAAEFVPAILDSIIANGMTVHASSGVSNLSLSLEDTPYGFTSVKFVKTGTDTEITDPMNYGPLKAGTQVDVTYPTITGYALHNAEETGATITVAAGKNNVAKTVEYDKTEVIMTIKAYTGTASEPGHLVGTKAISGAQGVAYEQANPSFDCYLTPEGSVSGSFPGDDGEILVYGYAFSAMASIADASYDYTIGAIPEIDATTGVYVSFDINSRDHGYETDSHPAIDNIAANGDWSKIFESANYLCFTGCHGLVSGARLYDLAHGHPGDYGEAWNALVSYGRTARLTFAYFPNGDMKAYRDGKLVLRWDAATVCENESTKTCANMAAAFIEDVHSTGFRFSSLITEGVEKNDGRYIRNVTIGKATDILEGATINVHNGNESITSYSTNIFRGDRFLDAEVPYGYVKGNVTVTGNVVDVEATPVEIAKTEKLNEAVVCDAKWSAGGWADRLFNVNGADYGVGVGDFYREINLTNFKVNDYAAGNWKGMLITYVSNMEAQAGQNMWSDKTYCLGNNNHWGTQTFPAMNTTAVHTQMDAWGTIDEGNVIVELTRHNRLYHTTLKVMQGETVLGTGYFDGVGVDFALDTIFLSAEFAKFTVSSVKVGSLA